MDMEKNLGRIELFHHDNRKPFNFIPSRTIKSLEKVQAKSPFTNEWAIYIYRPWEMTLGLPSTPMALHIPLIIN